jgi:16S rRNA (guanine527-N7)-methyltransferase
MHSTEQFRKDLAELHIELTEEQLQQFVFYYEMLVEQNKVMNLTAITEYDEVFKKHFIDSLSLVKACDLSKNLNLIDVGTGAGFPGIPLKIAFPNLKITLLDSLNKRVHFLKNVIQELKLDEIEAIHGRAEDFARGDLREYFDICVSRAVANMTTLSEYCIPFVKKGGCFISYKSEKITEESKEAERAITLLGGVIENQVELYLPDSDIYRNLFIIRKTRFTPKKYPRKAGLPTREPLV